MRGGDLYIYIYIYILYLYINLHVNNLYLFIHQVPVKEAQEVCVPVKQSKPRQECVMKPRQVTRYLVAAVLRTAE